MSLTINIAEDFSPIPGARYPSEGDFSGEEFRTNILAPKLKEAIANSEILVINLDGSCGYGTSFLEESFGGLIRTDKLELSDIHKHIKFISNDDPAYIEEIESYLSDADKKENS
jgi:hypothetical protein